MIFENNVNRYLKKNSHINYNGQLVSLATPKVMGILNVTPDSFFDGGEYTTNERCLQRIREMVNQGVDIIDVGGYSTRPGAAEVSADEEVKRISPVVALIKKHFPQVMISIDTFRASVANAVIQTHGTCIINDVSGGNLDKEMFKTVASLGVPYVLMHMRGTPQTMQQHTQYTDVATDVIYELSERLNTLYKLGAKDVMIDPGFGFAKTVDQNYELFNKMNRFQIFSEPLLVGVSRKSMIYKELGTDASDSLNGTTVLNTLALQSGANILRVHDVKQAVEAVTLVGKLKSTL